MRLVALDDLPYTERLVLAPAVAGLPLSRAHAVLSLRTAWMDAGLPSQAATTKSVSYARKLTGQRLIILKRLRANPVSKAAEKHEKFVEAVILGAVKKAQAKISLKDLEAEIAMGQVPWHALEPAIQVLVDALNG